MERENIQPSELIWWKRVGGKAFMFNGRHIKPNQKFQAKLEDIPEAFRDIILPLDQGEYEKSVTKEDVRAPAELEYFVKSRGAGYYDVVDGDGKLQNEKALRKDAADALVESLTA